MGKFLARRWFLVVLAGGVSLALARPETFLSWLGGLEPRWVVGAALFLMAWTLPSRSLARELSRPGAALWALAISYGLLPASAWLCGHLLPLADYRVGMMIISSAPCTLASAVLWTRMGGGNEATALLVILLSTSTSWLVTTGWLTLATGTAVAVAPLDMMRDLLLTLMLPVGLGQLCQALGPLVRAASRFRVTLGMVSQILVLAIVFTAAAKVGDKLNEGSSSLDFGTLVVAALLCFGLHLGVLGTGLWTCRWFGCDRPRQIAVAFACSQKTLPVALVLFERYFQNDFPLGLVPLLLYHVGQLVLDTFVADGLRNQSQEPGDIPASV